MPIPLIVWGVVAAAAYFASGCSDNKEEGSATDSGHANPLKNSTDEYVSKCDDAAKRMSEVAACGQYPHQTYAKGYPSSSSLYVPLDQDQWNVDRLLSNGKCMIKCEWWTPDQPKYNETSGLCEYLLVVPQGNSTGSNGNPYIDETTITTERSKSNAYEYFEYCLGEGYLP